MPKFTFKRGAKPTGLYRVIHPYPSTDIKLDGKEVGSINPPNDNSASLRPEPKWTIRLRKIDPNAENCGWTSITLKARFDDEQSARDFLIRNSEKIIAIGLHKFE
jgi:hypothetical protein